MEHTPRGSSVAAGYDPLTGLPDRTGFAGRARDLLGTAGRDALVGLCYLDLGSATVLADEVTAAMAQRLSVVAGRDTVLARLGPDEYALLTVGTGIFPGATAELASRVLQVLASFAADGYEMLVSARISIVERVAAETTHEDLMRAADHGMRRARAYWMAVDLDRACAMVRMG